MSKGMKTFLTICGIVIGAGLILAMIGAALGGIKGLSGVEEKVPWVSFGGAGRIESQNISTGDFHSVDIKCGLGSVQFIESNQYGAEISYDEKRDTPLARVVNGRLTINASGERRAWFNFDIFGGLSYKDTAIKIYYPKGTSFNHVKVKNDLGKIILNNVAAQIVDINASAGDVRINGLAAKHLNIESDLGDVTGSNVKTGGADVKISAGRIRMAGAFAGITKIDSDLGDCVLTTSIPKSSYSIDVSMDMGSCRIDGKKPGAAFKGGNPAAANQLKVKCSAGDAELKFQ